MIRIQSKNPLFRATLVSALSELEATDTELPEEETAVLLPSLHFKKDEIVKQ